MAHDEQRKSDSWWNRDGGGREVLHVAFPLVISSLSWTVMTFVDRVFLKWVSGEAISAAFTSSALWFVVIALPLGICAYANTFVAQYFGDGQLRRIGPSVWQGVWAAIAFTPLAIVGAAVAPFGFQLAGHSESVTQLEVTYFQVLCAGAPAMLISQALAAFFSGRSKTRVVMCVDAAFAVVNLVLDYLMIFGYAGFPAMGIAGAGWATVISLWLKVITYGWLILRPTFRERFATSDWGIDWQLFGRVIYFGGPSGLQIMLDVLGFTVFIMLLGRLGAVEAEATSMAFSISTLAFMPVHGLGIAASILVGQRLGENRVDLAERSTWTTLWIALAYMAGVSICYLLFPGAFLFLFFAGGEDVAANEAVWSLARTLLIFVAAYNLFDAALLIFANAIKGAGDTQFVLKVSLAMASLLGVLSWVCVEVLQLGIYGCWTLISAWVWGLGTIFFLRFRGGKWREMRVIEQQLEAETPALSIEEPEVVMP